MKGDAIESALVGLADAMHNTLMSPNESDSNWEAANIVDAMYRVARGLHHVARAVEGLGPKGGSDADAK